MNSYKPEKKWIANERLKTVNCFRLKAPSKIFERLLNTLQEFEDVGLSQQRKEIKKKVVHFPLTLWSLFQPI